MNTKKFTKEQLEELMDKPHKVFEEITDHDRWTIHYRVIFLFEGKHYEWHYSIGATETQDQGPFDYFTESDGECAEVHLQDRPTWVHVP